MTTATTLFSVPGDVEKSAVFSPCRVYRYELRRIWDRDTPPVLFVGLNPSTADETQDDPTIRRCIRFARDWGYGGLLMGNIFAFRATNPKDLPCRGTTTTTSPVGEQHPDDDDADADAGAGGNANDRHLQAMSREAWLTIAAWGATTMPSGWSQRPDDVLDALTPMHALKLTKDGHPWHPLYVKADVRPIPLPRPRR